MRMSKMRAGPSNRIGRFDIPFNMISESPETVLLMLAGKLVVRAEARYDLDAVEYHAYCDDFNEVGRGELAPEYIAEFDEHAETIKDDSEPMYSDEMYNNSPVKRKKITFVFKGWVRRK